jgi:nicotinate phosphoribosyltransferase
MSQQKEFELKQAGKIKRLTNRTFKFDSRIKDGWYSAVYFIKTARIVEKERPKHVVTMQFFQRHEAILCGIDESIALIHTFASNPSNLKISALHDGDKIKPLEPVLKITGHYEDFGHLEGLIDGILARRTSIATNVYQTAKEATPAKIFFMGDRDDHYLNQQGDGYAAYYGGVAAQATHAMNEWWGQEGTGTMPHALIQIFNGDLVKACEAYIKTYPNDRLVALVDFNNDVITDSLKVANRFKKRLYGVRVDTSIAIKDKYFNQFKDDKKEYYGVNPFLIKALRQALDKSGFRYVKIIVSSGFDIEKISWFKKEKAKVDLYGIGTSFLKVNIGFTGDLVNLDGLPLAKVGRKELPSKRLKVVDYNKTLNYKLSE